MSQFSPIAARPRQVGSRTAESDPTASRDAILVRAYQLAESGRFASLAALKHGLKAEGHVAVETALRGLHDRRDLRALCEATAPARSSD